MSLDIWLTIEVDTGGAALHGLQLYQANITHNIVPMWKEAGVYGALYDSEGKRAGKIINVLEAGVTDMKENPDKYIALNPPNGWGSYSGALSWLKRLLAECKKHPKSRIEISK